MGTQENYNRDIKTVQELLNDGNIDQVRELRQTEFFTNLLTNKPIELIDSISSFLNDKRLYKCPNIVICYEEILKVISEQVDPNDSFITFLEQIDEDSCSLDKFMVFIPPLRTSLEKLADSRGYWLEWALSTIKTYLDTLSRPEDHQVEFDVKKMLVSDRYLDSILSVCATLLNFFSAFVENYISQREKDALIVFGLQILVEPAMYVYVEKFPNLQQFYTTTIAHIETLTSSLHAYLDNLDDRRMTNLEKDELLDLEENDGDVNRTIWQRISTMNLAVYYWAVIRQQPFLQYFPQVYDKVYLFHKLLFLCVVLLRHSHNAVVRKGVHLSARLLDSMDANSVSHQYLEYKVHQHFIKVVSSISVYSYIFENRKQAIQLLLPYFRAFDAHGRKTLYMNVSSATNNPDVDAEIITSFRNSWYLNYSADRLEFFQKGEAFIDLLKAFCHLPDGNNTDMMVYKNKTMSVLYLFALLVKRDLQNATGLDEHFEYFEKNFLMMVKEAVKKSRLMFNEELRSLRSGHESMSSYGSGQMNVMVEGQPLPPLRRQDKVRAVESALTSLDMIDHALQLVYEYANREPSQLL